MEVCIDRCLTRANDRVSAVFVECSRVTVLSITPKWFKEGTVINQETGS